MALNSLKLKCAYETEIYISDAGYLVIKQENDINQMVMLTPEQTSDLFDFISMNREEHLDAWSADLTSSRGE